MPPSSHRQDRLFYSKGGRRLDKENIDSFENLHEFVDTTDYDATSVIPCIKQHMSPLMGFFKKYFPDNSSQYDWVRDSFNAPALTGFSSGEEEQFIDMTSDSTLRLKFTSQTLSEFWPSVERQYPLLGHRAIGIILPFATSYLRSQRSALPGRESFTKLGLIRTVQMGKTLLTFRTNLNNIYMKYMINNIKILYLHSRVMTILLFFLFSYH